MSAIDTGRILAPHRTTHVRKQAEQAPPDGDGIAEALLTSLVEGIQSRNPELRAVELVVEEVAAEFDGEDPLVPLVRQILETTRQKLKDVRSGLQRYAGEVDLPEPEEGDLEMMRKILKRAERIYA